MEIQNVGRVAAIETRYGQNTEQEYCWVVLHAQHRRISRNFSFTAINVRLYWTFVGVRAILANKDLALLFLGQWQAIILHWSKLLNT